MKDGQTLGQWLKWDFKANGNLEIMDKNDHRFYGEDSDGYWFKSEFDSNGDVIYFEDSSGYWSKREYNSEEKLIYYENSDGHIEDNRTPQIIEHNGHKYQLIP
jgi:hypothetical protein